MNLQTHAVLEHCWSVRPEQLPVNTSVEASRAHNAPNLEFLECLLFVSGTSPKRGCHPSTNKAEVSGVSVVSGVPDDGVDPWHTEKQDKRDRTINLEAAMQMTVTWQSQT